MLQHIAGGTSIMENEQVVRSIRAESEVFEQFKRISESFPNQGAALQGETDV